MPQVQGLFWNNLVGSSHESWSDPMIESLRENSLLKHHSDFFFVFTGTGEITLEGLPIEVSDLSNLQQDVIDVFLYEPVSYAFKDTGYNLGYYSEFSHTLNLSENLCAVELESLNLLAQQVGKQFRVFHCDYGLDQQFPQIYPNLDLRCMDILISYLSSTSKTMPLVSEVLRIQPPTTFDKRFWCGIRRYTVHRHLIMCYLYNKSGNYNWKFIIDNDFDSGKIPWLDNDLRHLIDSTITDLNNKDFDLETSDEKIKIADFSQVAIPHGAYSKNAEFIKSIKQCFCSVVAETRFAQPTANFSEKTTDAIYCEQPFVLVAPPRTLEYLRSLGFRTFDKWWDESYDQEQDHILRIKKIFTVLDYIDSLSDTEMVAMYQEMSPVINHNRIMLKNIIPNQKAQAGL